VLATRLQSVGMISAAWYVLPRRFKWCFGPMDLMHIQTARIARRYALETLAHHFAFTRMINRNYEAEA